MKLFLACILSFLLVGCATTPPPVPPVIVKTEIQKVTIPGNMLEMPPMPPSINLLTATQKDVAKWISDTEERMTALEAKLKTIKALNDK